MAAQGVRDTHAFGEPEVWRHEWERKYTRAQWLDQVPTHGGHSLLPRHQQDSILEGLGAAIGDRLTMGYTTVTVAAFRDPA